MPPPNSKDTSATSDHSAGSNTDKSPQDGTESPESRVSPAKRLDGPQEGSDGKYHCKPDDKCPGTRGFTKEDGLRRHEREVHEMHGGPKEMLLCTEPGCRRNSGKAFERKENLFEHCRRVHGDENSKLQTIARATVAMVTAAPQSDLDMRNNDVISDAITTRANCSGTDSSAASQDEIGEHKSEIRKLKEESSAMDYRIRRLEQNGDSRERRLAKVEEVLARMSAGEYLALEEQALVRPTVEES
jgi:hypothetical protein